MILSANFQDFTVPGKNIKVSVSGNLARKDMSGQTAATDSVNEGNKAEKISVALLIQKKNPNDLVELKEISRAVTLSGDPQVYLISHDLCNALKIREVIFCDTFEVSETDGLRAWDVKFNLKEYKSVAEKKESREISAQIKGTDSTGKEIKPSNNTDSAVTQTLKTAAATITA